MHNDQVKQSLMTHLETQEEFESLLKWKQGDPEVVIIYFTAKWCGPCKAVRLFDIIKSTPANIKWYVCDIDENDYTAGYCGVSKIPSWLAVVKGRHQPLMTSGDYNTVVSWAKSVHT
jgi:thiol-disulfide isomerase/thioredoxin